MIEELRMVGRRVKRRRSELSRDISTLHRLVREARAAGMSLRQIAEASGLSFGRIHQLTSNVSSHSDEDGLS